jgi:hypothetical protein
MGTAEKVGEVVEEVLQAPGKGCPRSLLAALSTTNLPQADKK